MPVTIWPPVAFKGFRLKLSEETTGGLIVRTLDMALPLSEAEIVLIVCICTGFDVTAKDVLVEPAGTVTFPGTDALELVFERVTVVPPEAAGPPRVTVPVAP